MSSGNDEEKETAISKYPSEPGKVVTYAGTGVFVSESTPLVIHNTKRHKPGEFTLTFARVLSCEEEDEAESLMYAKVIKYAFRSRAAVGIAVVEETWERCALHNGTFGWRPMETGKFPHMVYEGEKVMLLEGLLRSEMGPA